MPVRELRDSELLIQMRASIKKLSLRRLPSVAGRELPLAFRHCFVVVADVAVETAGVVAENETSDADDNDKGLDVFHGEFDWVEV